MGYNPTVENCAGGLPVPASFLTRSPILSPARNRGTRPPPGRFLRQGFLDFQSAGAENAAGFRLWIETARTLRPGFNL
jgi:hypothetical protein